MAARLLTVAITAPADGAVEVVVTTAFAVSFTPRDDGTLAACGGTALMLGLDDDDATTIALQPSAPPNQWSASWHAEAALPWSTVGRACRRARSAAAKRHLSRGDVVVGD